MSNPADRLLSDRAAAAVELEAVAVLNMDPLPPAMQSLAAAVVALTRDRTARLEMAACKHERVEAFRQAALSVSS